MARFETAYEYIKKWEGGYANVKGDKGGMTYAGITYKYFPTWSGWDYILPKLPLKHNVKFPELDDKVKNFYRLAFWDKYNFSKIIDQNVANILFDWFVNSGGNAAGTKGPETFGVDEILNRDFGFNLPFDQVIDNATINAINKVDAKKLYEIIKRERENYYRKLAQQTDQSQFLKGWLARLNSFGAYVGPALNITLIFLIVAILILLTLN